MAYLEAFSEAKSNLSEGRLLSATDADTNNCVKYFADTNDHLHLKHKFQNQYYFSL